MSNDEGADDSSGDPADGSERLQENHDAATHTARGEFAHERRGDGKLRAETHAGEETEDEEHVTDVANAEAPVAMP